MDKTLKKQAKKPSQARSKELVEAIFEATVRILPKVGTKNLTTKEIARIAGVSVGSLYQYFPNKDFILGALMDRAMRSTKEATEKKIIQLQGLSIDESVDFIIDHALETFLKDRQGVRELYRRAPELERLPSLFSLREQVVHQLAEAMFHHHPGRPKAEYVRVSFIAVNAIMGVIHTMIYDENQTYSIPELGFEMKLLLKAYLDIRQKCQDCPQGSSNVLTS